MALKHTYSRSGLGRALLAALAFVVGGASAFASGTQYYVNDHLATTVGIADAAGEIAALEADAFGSPVEAGASPGRYTGKPYDADMGAYVFPFRNYRAEEGRWMTADPSGFPDGVNGHAYNVNALSECDVYGLQRVKIWDEYLLTPSGQISHAVSLAAGVGGGIGGVGVGAAFGPGAPAAAAALGALGFGSATIGAIALAYDNFVNATLASYPGGANTYGSIVHTQYFDYNKTVKAADPATTEFHNVAKDFSWSLELTKVVFTAKVTSFKAYHWE